MSDLAALLARVEKATGPSIELDKLLSEAFGDKNDRGVLIVAGRWLGIAPLSGSIDAALGLVERVLPGWMWRVATCSVSDDAWVCPDFNHPLYGAEFQARFNDAFDGRDPAEVIIEATDVDRRPAGQPALAVVQSLLLALILLRALSTGAHP